MSKLDTFTACNNNAELHLDCYVFMTCFWFMSAYAMIGWMFFWERASSWKITLPNPMRILLIRKWTQFTKHNSELRRTRHHSFRVSFLAAIPFGVCLEAVRPSSIVTLSVILESLNRCYLFDKIPISCMLRRILFVVCFVSFWFSWNSLGAYKTN